MVQLGAGKLDEARKICDRLVDSDEANVDRSAENRFARATISSLQFFTVVAEAEPGCAIAYWGIAMSHWYPL